MRLASFDVEDWGVLPEYALQPVRARTRDAWITSYAFALETRAGYCRAAGKLKPTTDDLRRFLRACAKRGLTIVCWNATFDVGWLIALGLETEVKACRWLDAMLLYKHLVFAPDFIPGITRLFGLKPAVEKFLPEYAGYNKEVTFDPQDEFEWAELLKYNKLDAKLTLILARRFLRLLPAETVRLAIIEGASIPLVAKANVDGLAVDVDNARQLAEKLNDTANASLVTLRIFSSDATPEVLASPKQLSELLFDTWGLPWHKVTDTGQRSTDKEVLAVLASTDHRAKLVHDYREAANNKTKFADSIVASSEYNPDGRVRPEARIYSTYTGRMTYSSKQGKGKAERPTGVALHQWKRDPFYRRSIKAPEGFDLLEFDFAGQEYRWMAVESRDATMLRLCQPGEDPHSFMGSRVAHMRYEQLMADVAAEVPGAYDKRQLGKVANLSLQYRTSANRLRIVAKTDYGMELDYSDARAIHATYLTTYVGMRGYWDRQIYKARRDGYAQTIGGRRVHLGTGDTWPTSAWSWESTAINFPIQGVGADQKYLALCVIKDYLPRVDGRFYFELHDGLFFIVPSAYSQRACDDMKQIMSNLPYEKAWGFRPPIPFPVDAKIGKSWGDLKKVA
jgi:DNA polymerase I-like protein with 3'-5' exonuclease and polymerase domains